MESNENKYRRRIFFANVDQTELEYINNENFKSYEIKDQSSHQAIIRFGNNNSFEASLVNMEDFINNEKKKDNPLKQIEQQDFKGLKKLLFEFRQNYLNFIKDVLNTNENQLKEKLINQIKELDILYGNICKNIMYDILITPEKYNLETNLLEIFHSYYFFNEYKNIKDVKNELTLEKYYKKINSIIINHKYEQYLYSKLSKDDKLSELEKIKSLETISIFFFKCIRF